MLYSDGQNWALFCDGQATGPVVSLTGDVRHEDFLESYDPVLRRATGSYYTPVEAVDPTVRLVDLLVDRLGHPRGFESPGVTVVDPAGDRHLPVQGHGTASPPGWPTMKALGRSSPGSVRRSGAGWASSVAKGCV